MHLKIGDKVKIIAGKEKGKTGVVAKVLRAENQNNNKVVVEGLNMMKHFIKVKKQGDKGGVVEIAHPIHASNVALADKKAAKAKTEKKEKPAAKKKTAKKEKKAE